MIFREILTSHHGHGLFFIVIFIVDCLCHLFEELSKEDTLLSVLVTLVRCWYVLCKEYHITDRCSSLVRFQRKRPFRSFIVSRISVASWVFDIIVFKVARRGSRMKKDSNIVKMKEFLRSC
jgi:hypothetical protein